MPSNWSGQLNSKLGHFLGMMFFSFFIIACLLSLIYFQVTFESNVDRLPLQYALWKSSFILLIIAGVLSWIFVLIHDSHRVAQDETQRQTRLLQAEIYAHTETDLKLQKAKEIAEAANQAKNRYLSGISHELRSPLNSLLGYAQLLEKDQQLNEKTRESVTIIRHSGEFLADLIEGLLDISKIEAGKLDIMPSEINFPALLKQMVAMFRLQADEKNIKFIYERSQFLPEYVRVDEKHLRQILINLISNAIKYTAKGEVRFTVSYRSEIATFTIEDTGYGIAAADQQRIFNPFEQIHHPNAPYIQGTGLGLTITKLLIEIMGGDITLDSHLNSGSKFCVHLLMSSISQPKPKSIAEEIISGYHGERKLLMVVDDDPVQRKMMKEILEPLGFIVITASNGQECLDALNISTPDLFILDVSMPGMTGVQLAKNLRKNDIKTPIFFISANAQESSETIDQYYDENDFIIKPINIDLLFKKIDDNLAINWVYRNKPTSSKELLLTEEDYPSHSDRLTLDGMAKISYQIGISKKLDQLEADKLASPIFFNHIRELLKHSKFNDISKLLNR